MNEYFTFLRTLQERNWTLETAPVYVKTHCVYSLNRMKQLVYVTPEEEIILNNLLSEKFYDKPTK